MIDNPTAAVKREKAEGIADARRQEFVPVNPPGAMADSCRIAGYADGLAGGTTPVLLSPEMRTFGVSIQYLAR